MAFRNPNPEIWALEQRNADCGPICLPGWSVVCGVDFARAPCDCRGGDRGDVAIGLDPDQRLALRSALFGSVSGEAFYIGVMGSKRTSEKRAARLRRTGDLDDEALGRIRMPIGLDLGSKTPAEIALATLADVVRVMHKR